MSLQPSWPEWEGEGTEEIAEPHLIQKFPELDHLARLLRQQSVWEFWNPSHMARDSQQGIWGTNIQDDDNEGDDLYSAN